jgi:drug/metabolite transporter (DMT)-like permease
MDLGRNQSDPAKPPTSAQRFRTVARMSARGRVIAAVFYGGLSVVLVGVLFQVWAEILPGGISAQIGHNSEAYLAVLVLAAWTQYARPRLFGTSREWVVVGAFAAVAIAVGLILLASDWPSRFRTLNETCFALAVLVPYIQMHRRPSRMVAVGMALGVLIIVLVSQPTQVGTDLAETFGMLMLAPIAFDAIDRSILQPSEYTDPPVRFGWYAAMIILPVTMTVLEYEVGVGGLLGQITRYDVRIHEAFIAMFLIEIYFVVVLGRAGTRPRTADTPTKSSVSS